MTNPTLSTNLSVGHVLPNRWTVMAYCCSDRHGLVLCSFTNPDSTIDFATWSFCNGDLRSTANGHYHNSCYANAMDAAWTDFKQRVADMYMLS